MNLRRACFIICCVTALSSSIACAPKPVAKTPLTEAQKKFEAKCREYDLHVTTRIVGETFWIYATTKDPFFDLESTRETAAEVNKKPAQLYAVHYADGGYTEKNFAFEYDIIDRKKSKSEDNGYTNSPTKEFTDMYNHISIAINEVLLDVEKKDNKTTPQFIITVIADIKKGIEVKSIFYLEDLLRYMSQDIPYDEYMKRVIQETKGSPAIIGDEIGNHIQYKDIELTDFLSRQIINRINYKFQRSDQPINEDIDTVITGIIADNLRYYHFTDFNGIKLTNLRSNKKLSFEPAQLAHFGDDPDEKKGSNGGKLIHIRFENGEAKITE